MKVRNSVEECRHHKSEAAGSTPAGPTNWCVGIPHPRAHPKNCFGWFGGEKSLCWIICEIAEECRKYTSYWKREYNSAR
jgi:hypothetical protein